MPYANPSYRPHHAPPSATRAQRVSPTYSRWGETRDILIAGIVAALIVSKELLTLAVCSMFVIALMAGGLAIANDKRTVVEPLHTVRDAAR